MTVSTRLIHKSGEWVQTDLTLTAKDASPQAIGSAITYGRRYAVSALVGLAAEDDDGKAAQPSATPAALVNELPAAPKGLRFGSTTSRRSLTTATRRLPPMEGGAGRVPRLRHEPSQGDADGAPQARRGRAGQRMTIHECEQRSEQWLPYVRAG